MKICVLTHTFPKSESDVTAPFMHTLALGLKKKGNKVYILTPYTKELKRNTFPYKVITYRYIFPKSLHLLGYSRTLKEGSVLRLSAYFLSPLLVFFGIIALIKLCRREKIDIISSHWILPNGIIAFVVSKILKIPYTITLPGSDIFIAKKNIIFTKMAVLAANNAIMVSADSPKFLDELISLGAKIKNGSIIPYPVDTEKMKPEKKEAEKLKKNLKMRGKNLILLGVGRLVHKKGFSFLIQSFSTIVKKYPSSFLIIIGDGDLRQKLEALSKEFGISNNIVFTGYIDRNNILAYYNLADIFVMPSIKDKDGNMDDQPVALIEAMACGKPIIATNFPGIKLTVDDGKSGILIPEKNVEILTTALEKLILSKNMRENMGKESRKIILDKLSMEKIAEKYTNYFKMFNKS